MPILSLKDFMEQSRRRREVRLVTVRDFLHAIESNYDDGWDAEVTCDYPEPGSYLVKITPPEDV
nr:hypothetical protein [Nitrosomonas nitrosa]